MQSAIWTHHPQAQDRLPNHWASALPQISRSESPGDGAFFLQNMDDKVDDFISRDLFRLKICDFTIFKYVLRLFDAKTDANCGS